MKLTGEEVFMRFLSYYTLGFDVDIIRMKYVLRAATMLEFMLPLP